MSKKRSDIEIIKLYWKSYGGFKSFFNSKYLWLSLFILVLTISIWTKPGWWDLCIEIIPNIVGFSLGGYAIFIAFGNREFQQLLSVNKSESDTYPFLMVSSSFAHFVLMQASSLLIAIVLKAMYIPMPSIIKITVTRMGINLDSFNLVMQYSFWGIGFLIFIYGLTLSIAATISIFRLTDWLGKFYQQSQRMSENSNSTTNDDDEKMDPNK